MAGVDVGGGERRARNSEINMIPFIDLLMVTIAFLLITAVWVTNARLRTSAEAPAAAGCGEECQKEPLKTMHVHVRDDTFSVVWKQGATVLSEVTVPRHPVEVGAAGATAIRYRELGEAIQREWERSGEHRGPSDRRAEQAVLHSDDKTPFRELVAVLDAINAPRRTVLLEDGRSAEMPAFLATFSAR
ncbi:biopolymer transporter [Sorangium cellulosum]|uniref:Biopolymer transporter n=1 Tax=Sorangium cellulosum TaxID=56 RepID=A0A2L0F3V9_SORCE|nr:biopolymer transporter ExbD [Sorangium cellulosum]AUX46250.1 biopolymer transporter [Sorangium cellulosum]